MITFAENHRPLILVTNDDGIDAKGIKTLAAIAGEMGNVLVVAPEAPHSAMSHAITVREPLYLTKTYEADRLIMYKTNGTPADCIKLALHTLLDRRPDLVLSGINHGTNSSASVHYSGTLGAAREGAINGLNAVGLSLLDFSADADFSPVAPFCRHVIERVIEEGLPIGTFLNVNMPKQSPIKGVRVCRQAKGKWVEEFVEHQDPRGRDYYWLTGYYQNLEPQANDTDEYALGHGFVSVVPCNVDISDHSLLEPLKKRSFEMDVKGVESL